MENIAVTITNTTNEDFVGKWDGAIYKLGAGKSLTVVVYVARHLAKHLAQRELQKEGNPLYLDSKVVSEKLEEYMNVEEKTVVKKEVVEEVKDIAVDEVVEEVEKEAPKVRTKAKK